MRKKFFFCIIVFVFAIGMQAQNNRERRLFLNDYVSPEELVSMSKTLPFEKAISIFGEFSKKYVNKIIVDVSNTKKSIGVDIENKYWLAAFETVLRANNLWYDEKEEYFQVYAIIDSTKLAQKESGTTKSEIDTTSKVIYRTRDVRISSVFFTVDVVKSLEAGINWSFLYKGDTTQVGRKPSQFGAEFNSGFRDPQAQTSSTGGGGGGASAQQVVAGFFGRAMPAISFSNVSALISFFQSNQLGDVLSGPSIIVSSGKNGKIQVGQDFYVTTKDFAGNTVQSIQSTGIIIDVTPTVYEENGVRFISLDIDAQRSTLTSAGSNPIVNKSQAKTYSILFDGEETIIGGLYTNQEVVERGGVPILKDLPWWVLGLRYLFGYDKSTSSTQELIILLRAEVVPTLEERITNKQRDAQLLEKQRKQNASEIERLKTKKQ